MKRRFITSCILSLCFLMNTVTVSFAQGDLVESKKMVGNILTVEGCGDKVSIFLLKPGKNVEDFKSVVTDDEFDDAVKYCNVLSTGFDKKYSDTFEIIGATENDKYILYVKDGKNEEISEVMIASKIYVSADAAPNGDGSEERPFKSVEEARDAIAQQDIIRPVDVIIKGGEYKLKETIKFNAENSGSEGNEITYKAAEGEKVVFTGTTELDVSEAKVVTNSAILDRVVETVRGKIVEIDLKEQGIPEEIVAFDANLSVGNSAPAMRLYLNDAEQKLARWPNVGYNLISTADGGGSASAGTSSLGGATIGIENLDNERALRWKNAENMYIEGYLANGWHREWAKVKSVDDENAKIKLARHTQYGTNVGMRVAAVNLLEELDTAGEWYADSKNMKLYYYPPYELTTFDSLEIAIVYQNFMTFDGASYINVEGIEFSKNATSPFGGSVTDVGGNGIAIIGESNHIDVSECKFNKIGMNGVHINKATDVTIDNCVIYDMGYNGIYISSAGNRKEQKTGNVVVSNCHISDVSRDNGSNSMCGIRITGGVGTIVENNVFNNIKNSAVRYSGNGHIIRKNEIYNCVNETSDAGAVYAGRSWSEYGTSVENNYFHDIGAGLDYNLANAMFWDDSHSGNSFVGNIVNMNNAVRTSGVQVGGGRDNVVKGNIFLNSAYGIRGEDRTVNIPATFDESDTGSFFNQTLFMSFKDASDITSHPYYIMAENWREMYQRLYPGIMVNFGNIVNDKNYSRANIYSDNVFYNCHSKINLEEKHENDSTQSNNRGITLSSSFVNYNGGDYRIKNDVKSLYRLAAEVPDENFSMTSIGIQNNYVIEDMSFGLVYPENNAKFAQNETLLKWNEAPLADNYTYQVATDSEFKNIVASGTTTYTEQKISGLSFNTQYYWKVTANSISARFGASKDAEKVFTFTTDGELTVEAIGYNEDTEKAEFIVSNTSLADDEITIITTVKDKAGKLLGVRSGVVAVKANSVGTVSLSTVFENITNVDSVECYVWESYSNNKPVADKKVFILN